MLKYTNIKTWLKFDIFLNGNFIRKSEENTRMPGAGESAGSCEAWYGTVGYSTCWLCSMLHLRVSDTHENSIPKSYDTDLFAMGKATTYFFVTRPPHGA